MRRANKAVGLGRTLNTMVVTVLWLAAAAGGPAADTAVAGENDPAVRFRGPLTYDFAVTNVKWEAATPEYSYVTFDLSWSYSWRAKWTEPAKMSATGQDMEVENWDAAWVFVKFLPEKDSKGSIESNLWQHATLDTDATRHVLPAGATNTVGTTDDGSRGLGVFIFRDAIGNGVNDWKGIKLRWLIGTDKVDPAKAAVKVMALPMVYVPGGAFMLGSGSRSRVPPFPDGPTWPFVEGRPNSDIGCFTDGSWRGGLTIPFLVDAEWSGCAGDGATSRTARARRIGVVSGQLWATSGFMQHIRSSGYASTIGAPGTLPDEYPTGYDAFYCMKHLLTQGQYVDFLNALPPKAAAALASVPSGEFAPQTNDPYPWEKTGLTITDPAMIKIGKPKKKDKPLESGEDQVETGGAADMLLEEPKKKKEDVVVSRPGYTARLPNRTCNYLMWQDGYAYAMWAGLRPMSELEFEKACRGALRPVPGESAWGPMDSVRGTDLRHGDTPMERYGQGNSHGLGNRDWDEKTGMSENWKETAVRAGIFATPESDRVQAAATYWGVLDMELATFVAPIGTAEGRFFRASHGDGSAPTNAACRMPDWPTPGARMGYGPMSQRSSACIPEDRAPNDFNNGRGRSNRSCWRGVRSVAVNKRAAVMAKPAPTRFEPVRVPTGTRPNPADWDVPRDNIRIGNDRRAAGSEQYSTVTCDVEWDNSWRAVWTEPAEKNVTGKPMQVESWDAAWVFVKFRNPGDKAYSHAMLSPNPADHEAPAGATLALGLNDEEDLGLGVFVYRSTVGQGKNVFKGIKLRWAHAPALMRAMASNQVAQSAVSPRYPVGKEALFDPAKFDPAKAEVKVFAVPMVYVPGGPFHAKGPWGNPLGLISDPDPTRTNGCRGAVQMESLLLYYVYAVPDLARRRFAQGCGLDGNVGLNDSAWPNGFKPFYCMKYPIGQGEFAALLNTLDPSMITMGWPAWISENHYNFNRYTIRRSEDNSRYVADVPDRAYNHLGYSAIYGYAGWAGLRPLTDLEYEKACRGPRAVARAEDAWNASACALATGLDTKVGMPPAGATVSYWGIRDLSLSGCPFEWPWTMHDDAGRTFKGTHGGGMPLQRSDWLGEWGADGNIQFYNGSVGGLIATWIDPSEMGRIEERNGRDRSGRYGARLARTAPALQNDDSPLQISPVSSLIGCDVGVFYLSGRFKNDANKPLRVELVTKFPDICFPDGTASRAFTAAPKGFTPFKILTVLTRQTAAEALAGGRVLSFRIQAGDGDLLAEQSIPVPMPDAKDANPPIISALAGGSALLRITNATDRPFTLAIRMLPADIKLAETNRSVTVAAGASAGATFAVPRQGFRTSGDCRLPCTIAVANSALQNAEAVVELRPTSRWWTSKRVAAAKKAAGDGAGPGELDDDSGLAEVVNYDANIFKSDALPKGWQRATYGAELSFGAAGQLPTRGSAMQAATRVESPGELNAMVEVLHETTDGKASYDFTVWFNDTVVFNSAKEVSGRSKSFRILKTGNTMVVECRSFNDRPVIPGKIMLQFRDAKKEGKPVNDLVFDVEKK